MKHSEFKALKTLFLTLFILLLPVHAFTQDGKFHIDRPEFSYKRGFYNEPFTLHITSNYVGAQIVYTLDGSDPKISTTAISADSPCEISIDPQNIEGRGGITPGVFVRAFAWAYDTDSSSLVTHSYIFPGEVITQDDPGGFWNDLQATYTWPGYTSPQSIDYAMDEKITKDARYEGSMMKALSDLPSFSVVTEYKDMFDPAGGIFMNSLELGLECPASIEMINPLNGENFQIDAGIRIRGRYSRLPRNPKHSFRLFFRNEYGDAKLKYSLFGEGATDEFDHLDFRTAQNSSWNAENGNEETVTFLKEIFARDAQGKMDMLHTRSIYCHLYLNGMYWGLFQIMERADDHFAESYIGGDKSEYDVLKPQQNVTNPEEDLKIGVSEGNLYAAQMLWDDMLEGFSSDLAYFAVQGLNSDGSVNPELIPLLDVENLIDYLLVAFYMGSEDGPGVIWQSLWGHTIRPNNFIGLFNRENPDGFKWIVHDFEKGMYHKNDNWPLVENDETWFSKEFTFFNPLTIHRALMANGEYRQKFNDRVYKHFREDGVFNKDTVREMFLIRKSQIDTAVFAESARWGDWINWRPVQTPANWLSNVNYLLNDYIPYRTDIVLGQFAQLGVYNNLLAPEITCNSQRIGFGWSLLEKGSMIKFSDANSQSGQIYYTTNGSDPRDIGGTINSAALLAENNQLIPLEKYTHLMSRILRDGTWSPLIESDLAVRQDFSGLKLTEIHYNPVSRDSIDGSDLEFIELKNTGDVELDLIAYGFTDGISFTFDSLNLLPGNFLVLASDTSAFFTSYGIRADGQFEGKLNNSGEKIEFSSPIGKEIFSVSYDDSDPWPLSADGSGNSLVASGKSGQIDPDNPVYWRNSSFFGGSPGEDDQEIVRPMVRINEVIANTLAPEVDKIELYNPSVSPVDISYWFLTDERETPCRWQIPAGTIIPPDDYISFRAGHYVDTTLLTDDNEFGAAFLLSSHGEDVFLFEADQDSVLSGYNHGVRMPESQEGLSYGFHTNSMGDSFFVAQSEQSFGWENADPRIGPVILSEIMYHPLDGKYEYVKLLNISSDTQVFFSESTWKGWRKV